MNVASFQTNNLPEFVMIAGNSEVLEFELYDANNEPIILTGSIIKWTLAPYGQLGYNVCEIDGVIDENKKNIFTVSIPTHLTEDLEHGKYIQQPVIEDVTGEQSRIGQGIITILNRIPLI